MARAAAAAGTVGSEEASRRTRSVAIDNLFVVLSSASAASAPAACSCARLDSSPSTFASENDAS